MNNGNFIAILCAIAIFLVGCLVVELANKNDSSYKDVVCNGLIVLSGSGRVYQEANIYTLEGKTYQMKDGETCKVNDSYMNVIIREGK